MVQYEHESLLASKILDDLGYGKSMGSLRTNWIKKTESVINDKISNKIPVCIIISGSKAEGLTAPLESDFDFMEVFLEVICKEDLRCLRHEEHIYKFHLEMNHSCSGYTLLRNINSLPSEDVFYESTICLGPGQYYLSSDLFRNAIKGPIIEEINLPKYLDVVNVVKEYHGPSIRTIDLSYSKDQVMAFTSECPTYKKEWKCRKRPHQWPPKDVIREVSSLESHVVPVGSKTSSIWNLQWRICFTKGEIRLVHSLNDCLTKVLYVLKQIAQVALKPISKDISSYIIKNVVFWMAEKNNYDLFSQQNLISIIMKGLTNLKQFVLVNFLPNYMIPQRNLFDTIFTNRQRSKICKIIDSLLEKGPSMIMICEKFRSALSDSPLKFRIFSKQLHQAQFMSYLFQYKLSSRLPFWGEPFTLVDCMRFILSDMRTRFMLKRYLINLGVTHYKADEALIEADNAISKDPTNCVHICIESNMYNVLSLLS